MKNKVIFDHKGRLVIHIGLTRRQMIYQIHMATDTSSWCHKASDAELIEGYRKIFGLLLDELPVNP